MIRVAIVFMCKKDYPLLFLDFVEVDNQQLYFQVAGPLAGLRRQARMSVR
jgi:hypothetical protein